MAIVGAVFAAAVAFRFTAGPELRPSRAVLTGESASDQSQFEVRVRNYLLEHPEVIIEAIQELEARRQAEAQSEAAGMLAARTDELYADPDSPVGGNTAGDATIVEFFDYNCPYCRRVASVLTEAIAADAGLRVVYKEFPILGANSVLAARAALAAHRQGRYVEFHEALMTRQGVIDSNAVWDAAEALGLDVTQLRRDMEDPNVQAAIERSIELARALRITGTPGFVIGDQILRGATDLGMMQSLVQRARESR
ncbi:MAG: DsbA family protein [Alphaproteobacteria bacterium]